MLERKTVRKTAGSPEEGIQTCLKKKKKKKEEAWKNCGFGIANIREIQDSTSNRRRHSRASKNAMLMK